MLTGQFAAPVHVVRMVDIREKNLHRHRGGGDEKDLEDWRVDAQQLETAQQPSDQDVASRPYDKLDPESSSK